MIEIPEAVTLAGQISRAMTGRQVEEVEANHTPHGMTGFHGDPAGYPALLHGRTVRGATAWGGLIEIAADDVRLVLGDGAYPRRYAAGETLPPRHQLHLGFDDGTSLVVSVQMYGAVLALGPDAVPEALYHRAAMTHPSPLSDAFDGAYVAGLLADPAVRGRSVKAFLATGQRIPGLGNGTLQDICWSARLLPTRTMSTLSDAETDALVGSVRTTLATMTAQGGRDTERDLFGQHGGYVTVMGRGALGLPCPRCGAEVATKAYLGGAVYFCPGCQV